MAVSVALENPGPIKNTSVGGDIWSRNGGNELGWASKAAACLGIVGTTAAPGQRFSAVVAINEGGKAVEYWWPGPDFSDAGLVKKVPDAVAVTPQRIPRNAPWEVGAWFAGENAFVGQKIFKARQDIADSQTAPSATSAFWLLIYDAAAPLDYALDEDLQTAVTALNVTLTNHHNRITALENLPPGGGGAAGKSAYQSALDTGFVGSEAQWIVSLMGAPGQNAYQLAQAQGFAGNMVQWLASLVGAQGDSAYQIAVNNGFSGTQVQWLATLKGADGDGADLRLVNFTPSATLNSIKAGILIPDEGLLEAFKRALTRDRVAMAVNIAVSTNIFEQGEAPTVTVSGGISLNDESAGIATRQVYRNGAIWQTFTGNTFNYPDTPTQTTTYEVRVTGNTDGLKTASVNVAFDLKHRYGPAAARPDSTTARNLTGSHFLTRENKDQDPADATQILILNTGTTQKNFYILVAPNEDLQEVRDFDTNVVITEAFALIGLVPVKNAAGVEVPGFQLREMINQVPYATNHRLQITVKTR